MIDTDEKLSAFLPTIHAAAWVAVDTEADSLHAYPEKICLIQISTVDGDVLVDPLANLKLPPLLNALASHQLLMHGADYDLRLFRKHHDFVPSAIFDTMLAARLLGHQQFGLSSLVETYLGVKLEKGSQKANWARRPLTERMEQYARNDTHYLKPLVDKLRQELVEKGRLAWHEESCARLIRDCTEPRPADTDSVWRLKGSHALTRAGLAVLRELWRWRETEAVAANKPPFFILGHDVLVDMADAAASQRPVDPLVPRHLTSRRRSGLAEAIHNGLQVPPGQQPEILKFFSKRPNESERRRCGEITRRRDAAATKYSIDPTIIASRSVLMELARDWATHSQELMNWQREMLA